MLYNYLDTFYGKSSLWVRSWAKTLRSSGSGLLLLLLALLLLFPQLLPVWRCRGPLLLFPELRPVCRGFKFSSKNIVFYILFAFLNYTVIAKLYYTNMN